MKKPGLPLISSWPALLPAGFLFLLYSCSVTGKQRVAPYHYKPDPPELYADIVKQDSLFFTAYNTCDMATQAACYADTIEFYHDKGGLSTSKADILEGTKNNICGKVTRELVKGSIEVYPIKDFGAVEMGLHIFHNKEEPGAPLPASKFIIFWRQRDGRWQMTKVVSLH